MRGRFRRGCWMRRWAWILLEKAGESFWKFRTRLGRDLDVWGGCGDLGLLLCVGCEMGFITAKSLEGRGEIG